MWCLKKVHKGISPLVIGQTSKDYHPFLVSAFPQVDIFCSKKGQWIANNCLETFNMAWFGLQVSMSFLEAWLTDSDM